QRCDSDKLKARIREAIGADASNQASSGDAQLKQHLGDEKVRQSMRRAICHFPTEWDSANMQTRYRWQRDPNLAFKLNIEENWQRFVKHLKAITFNDLPQDYRDAFWHVHPAQFIAHMRKCGWLSENEARQLFPASALRKAKGAWVSEPVSPGWERLTNNLIELNKTARKYLISTPERLAAFYGNAMQETQWFALIAESGGQNARYAPWYGRGFLQLTWPANYIKYARFKGIHVSAQLDSQLDTAQKTADKMSSNTALLALEGQISNDLRDLRKSLEPAPDAREPGPSDSAGAYWAWSKAAKCADQSANFVYVSVPAGAGTEVYYTHASFGNVAATVNVGHASTNYASIYGIQARFQAHASAAMVLSEGALFPDANGQMMEHPQGWAKKSLR
ncbi:MAG: hypothetical protein AAGB30_13725, partial [Pedobacter sp.]